MKRKAPRRSAKPATGGDQELRERRERIDALDEQIQALVTERAQQAQAIAAIKSANGDTQFYRPER